MSIPVGQDVHNQNPSQERWLDPSTKIVKDSEIDWSLVECCG